jgi:hypothetical protein
MIIIITRIAEHLRESFYAVKLEELEPERTNLPKHNLFRDIYVFSFRYFTTHGSH